MKSDRQGGSCPDQLACRRYVDVPVMIESADHDAGGATLTGKVDVPLHHIDFVGRISEVATTWSNQHERRNPYALYYRSN